MYVMSSGSVCGVSWDFLCVGFSRVFYVCGIQSGLLCVWD